MKLVKTYEERKIAKSFKACGRLFGVKKFAFFPVHIDDDGSYVWLEFYWAFQRYTTERGNGPDTPPIYIIPQGRLVTRKRQPCFYDEERIKGDIKKFLDWYYTERGNK